MGDFLGARDELRQRVLKQLQQLPTVPTPGTAESYADAVMALFYEVEDEWRQIDITTWGDGETRVWLDERFLVAKVPAQSLTQARPTNRSVP